MFKSIKSVLCFVLLIAMLAAMPLASFANEVKPVAPKAVVNANSAQAVDMLYVPSTNYQMTYKDYLGDKYLKNTAQRNFYGAVVSSLENYPASSLALEFDITYIFQNAGGELLNQDQVIDVLYCIFSDHAEFFWFYSIGYGSYYDPVDNIFVITLYIYADSIWDTNAQLQNDEINFEKEVDKIVASCPTTSIYDAVVYFEDWLCKNNVYSIIASGGYTISNTAVSAILSKNNEYTGPVCQGYSTAFKYLCDKVGIQCVMVLGNAYDTGGLMGAHAWNYVNFAGTWYALDITWNDSLGDKSHFLVGSQTVCIPSDGPYYDQWNESHKSDMSTDRLRSVYPTLSTSAYVPGGSNATIAPIVTNTPGITPVPTASPIPGKPNAVIDVDFSSGSMVDSKGILTLDGSTTYTKDLSSYGSHISGLKLDSAINVTGSVDLGNAFAIELYGVFDNGIIFNGATHWTAEIEGGKLSVWSTTDSSLLATTTKMDLTKAHHIVIVGNKTNMLIYVDGVLSGQGVFTVPSNPLSVGKFYIQPSVLYAMRYRVYTTAVTQADVKEMYYEFYPELAPTPEPSPTPVVTEPPVVSKLELLDSEGKVSLSDGFVFGLEAELTSESVIALFDNAENVKIKKGNNDLDSSSLVGTGCIIYILDSNGDVSDSATVVIKGEINGDGRVNVTDYLLAKRQMGNTNLLSGAKFFAADIDGNGTVSTADYLKIKRHMGGKYNLYA